MLTSLFQAAAVTVALATTSSDTTHGVRAVQTDSVFAHDANADSGYAAPAIDPRLTWSSAADTAPRRRRAIEYSDWYYRRLTVHRWASYAMLPLFAGEYVYGRKLLREKTGTFDGRGDRRGDGVSETDRGVHQLFAGSVAAVFGVNTLTGLWNLYDSRRDPANRTLRVTHSLLLLASDAGFVATGLIAERASEGGPAEGRTHRNVALASMSVATLGTGMMWLIHH